MPRCAVCGQDNPGGFRFCGACGASLAGPARAPAEERRLVTVLFCDLVGFTARSDQADPEDVGALLRPYHARFRAEIERLGGTLDKFIGDGVMAVFGAPVAHEDDPEPAVRCALGMLTAIEELNLAHPSLDLAVRIGITTGEALVRLGPDQRSEGVVGDVVNTASRLEGVAPAGGVVVGEATFRATRRLFDYQELAPVKVKGKTDPVPVWRLEGARSRSGIEAVGRAGAPFVGRQVELDLLKGLFEQTMADRVVRLVTVVGEPGAGKSRFVGELAASADDRPELVIWRQGRCLPYGDGITFWALGEIVKAQAGILESDPSSEVSAKLEAAVADLLADPSERGWLRERLAPLVGIAGPDAVKAERAALPVGVQALLLERAAGNPLYAEEFARLLADQGLVVEGEVAAAPDIPVPETVHGLIAARLDTLTPEVRALVQNAAVVGRVFWPGAVAAMDGNRPAGADASAGPGTAGHAPPDGPAQLERQQLIPRAPPSPGQHPDEYVF